MLVNRSQCCEENEHFIKLQMYKLAINKLDECDIPYTVPIHFNWTFLTQVLKEHFFPKISPCSPGIRWMTFGLRRAKMLG